MKYEIRYECTDALVKSFLGNWMVRDFGPWLLACLVVISIGTTNLVNGSEDGFWWIAITAPIVYGLMWIRAYWRARNAFDYGPDRWVRVCADDECITFEYSDKTYILKWSAIKRVMKREGFLWLLDRRGQPINVIPLDALGDELGLFIEERARAQGGKAA